MKKKAKRQLVSTGAYNGIRIQFLELYLNGYFGYDHIPAALVSNASLGGAGYKSTGTMICSHLRLDPQVCRERKKIITLFSRWYNSMQGSSWERAISPVTLTPCVSFFSFSSA